MGCSFIRLLGLYIRY